MADNIMTDIQPLSFEGIDMSRPIVIAGPCSAESEEQTLATARGLASMGLRLFRAGLWKPRTKPGGFEGVGAMGLDWLCRVKEETGMYVLTEVATAEHVKAAIGAGLDGLWIGARTTANPFAMQEIADAIAALNPNIPVLVKNPVNPDLELWIGAIERLYNAGILNIAAIHRGFSVYGRHLYRNMPEWSIPIELRRRIPNLQIIHDPSHVGGKRDLIAPLSQQAMDMDFDGLMIETHCRPEQALSDTEQQITPHELGDILSNLIFRKERTSTENLERLRNQLDQLDNELIEVLGKRMALSREIGQYKLEHDMTVFQLDRHDDVMRSRLHASGEIGLNPKFMENLMRTIHEESVRVQVELFNSLNKKGDSN